MKENSFYLKALAEGNSKEITLLYKANFPKIKTFVLQNKGQKQDAEDVFQKALIQLTVRYQKEPFVIKSSFDAYLFTVCKNLWRRELNKSKNKVTSDHVIELVDDVKDQAMAMVEQKQWELFTETLELISDNCKEVLKLFFAKVPYSEIIKKLGYNTETVARQRVFKCKSKLTQLIKKDQRFKLLKEL